MKWIVLAALIATWVGHTNAMTLTLDQTHHFDANQKESVVIPVDQPRYLRGYIRSDSTLAKVNIRNSQGKIVKTLIGSPSKEVEIFWFIAQPDDYQFEFTSVKQTPVNIELRFNELALKNNQYLSPDIPIISPLLMETAKQLNQDTSEAEQVFWQQLKTRGGAPLVEYKENGNAIVTFLYKGIANNVRLLGAPYSGHEHLRQLGNSGIWFHSFEVPPDTRLSYQIAPNVPQLIDSKSREQRRAVLATAQPDRLNPNPNFGEGDNLFGSASTLTLSHNINDNFVNDINNPKGSVTDFIYNGNENSLPRKVSIYQPNSLYPIESNAPLLILFDGDAYLDKVPTPIILDNLIAKKIVPPMRAVFINTPLPSMRGKELTPNKAYSDFLALEFMPWLCEQQTICPNAEDTILSGSSYGGLASMHIAFQHPEKFGNVLSQSGSFWWAPQSDTSSESTNNWMADLIRSEPNKPIHIYLNAGLFEIEPASKNILDTNRQLYKALLEKGYTTTFQEAPGGHDYFSWRVMLVQGLTTLFTNKNKDSI
ncbi:alpha/beta hydrolase-fold protein [Vibrio sp. WJH972]